MALEAEREIEMVVGIVRSAAAACTNNSRTVVILSAYRNAFVVQHLGQRQFTGNAGKRLLGLARKNRR